MIDIFLIAASIDNAQCIVQCLEASGVRYRLRTAYGSVRQLRTHARVIRGADLLTADPAVVNQTVRGRAITFVPQDPFTSFNPVFIPDAPCAHHYNTNA